MVLINTTEDLLRLLDENEQFHTAVRYKILTEELIRLPGEFGEFKDEMVEFKNEMVEFKGEMIEFKGEMIEFKGEMIEFKGEMIEFKGEMVEFKDEMKEFRCEVRESSRVNSGHISDMRGLFASQRVVREAALIADRMGLRVVRTLEAQDIIDIWNAGREKGLTETVSKSDEDSFKLADLVIEAQTDERLAGARSACYLAVEISYTVDGRDTTRAIRNAEYISKFVEIPTYAVVAGISKDNRIDEVLSDIPEPYDSERETRVFWSKHEDVGKPN